MDSRQGTRCNNGRRGISGSLLSQPEIDLVLITACVRLFIVAAVIVVIVVVVFFFNKNINQNKSSYFVLGTGFE